MPTETDLLTQEVLVQASRETVFPFLTDPARMVRWMGRAATLDPRPGGVYRVEVNDQATALGEYVEVDPPNRVVFTFGWEHGDVVGPGSTTVEIDLVPEGDATLVRLTHRGLPAEAVELHTQGWQNYLPRLAIAAPGGDPGPDPIGSPQTH